MTNALLTAQFTASFSSVGVSDGSGFLSWGNSQRFQVTGLASVGNIPGNTLRPTWFGVVASTSSVLITFPATVSVGDVLSYPAVGSTIFLTYDTTLGSGGSSLQRETPLRVT